MALKEDNALINGTGNAPEIKGLNVYATAFNAAAYVAAGGSKVKACGIADLIRKLAREIATDTMYMPNVCYLNPADFSLFDELKDLNENYVRVPFVTYNIDGSIRVGAVQIIETSSQAVNTLTIGDSAYARLYDGQAVNLSYGYNKSQDFEKNILSIKANQEEFLLIRTCEQTSFLKSTSISADITTLTA
jgi:HK97 family phage major capsid protein